MVGLNQLYVVKPSDICIECLMQSTADANLIFFWLCTRPRKVVYCHKSVDDQYSRSGAVGCKSRRQ